MSTEFDVVKAFGDAYVLSYERTFDDLILKIKLWDDSLATLEARFVGHHQDTGTWALEAIVRERSLDIGEAVGYAIIDTEDQQSLRFSARGLMFRDATGRVEDLGQSKQR